MVGLLGSPSLDQQLQQAVVQLLALGMWQAQSTISVTRASAVSAGNIGGSGRVLLHNDLNSTGVTQMHVYVDYMAAVQGLLQHHGGRLLAGGDPATAMQLVAMLRGMAAAHQQVRRNHGSQPRGTPIRRTGLEGLSQRLKLNRLVAAF